MKSILIEIQLSFSFFTFEGKQIWAEFPLHKCYYDAKYGLLWLCGYDSLCFPILKSQGNVEHVWI